MSNDGRVGIVFETMRDAHKNMLAISHEMDGTLDTLRRELQALDWVGTDRDAYRGAQDSWDRAITDMNEVLNAIASVVATSHETYVDTEKTNAGMWNRGGGDSPGAVGGQRRM